MALTDLLNIREVFRGESSDLGPDVYRELLLMVLARAADADAHTDAAEVETVQRVLQEHLGEDISSADVRVASKSALYESAPLEKYVARIGPKLSLSQRVNLVHALVEVVRADAKVASAEADYFNRICDALQLSFADVMGLTSN